MIRKTVLILSFIAAVSLWIISFSLAQHTGHGATAPKKAPNLPKRSPLPHNRLHRSLLHSRKKPPHG